MLSAPSTRVKVRCAALTRGIVAVKIGPILSRTLAGALACVAVGLAAAPAVAHHSFAMYDQTKILVLTGVVYQFVAQANHAELHIYLIGRASCRERV